LTSREMARGLKKWGKFSTDHVVPVRRIFIYISWSIQSFLAIDFRADYRCLPFVLLFLVEFKFPAGERRWYSQAFKQGLKFRVKK
jgi:hypothetical protein